MACGKRVSHLRNQMRQQGEYLYGKRRNLLYGEGRTALRDSGRTEKGRHNPYDSRNGRKGDSAGRFRAGGEQRDAGRAGSDGKGLRSGEVRGGVSGLLADGNEIMSQITAFFSAEEMGKSEAERFSGIQ